MKMDEKKKGLQKLEKQIIEGTLKDYKKICLFEI